MEKKYKPQITLKIGSIIEAKGIAEEKQAYRRWKNEDNMRNHNPNLNKVFLPKTQMTYLFQKMSHKKKIKPVKTEPS